MAYVNDLSADTDMLSLDHRLGPACGDNAMNWARAFCAIAKSKGVDLGDDPEGWMVGWFANAIECSQDARNGTRPTVLPDGSAFVS